MSFEWQMNRLLLFLGFVTVFFWRRWNRDGREPVDGILMTVSCKNAAHLNLEGNLMVVFCSGGSFGILIWLLTLVAGPWDCGRQKKCHTWQLPRQKLIEWCSNGSKMMGNGACCFFMAVVGWKIVLVSYWGHNIALASIRNVMGWQSSVLMGLWVIKLDFVTVMCNKSDSAGVFKNFNNKVYLPTNWRQENIKRSYWRIFRGTAHHYSGTFWTWTHTDSCRRTIFLFLAFFMVSECFRDFLRAFTHLWDYGSSFPDDFWEKNRFEKVLIAFLGI